MKIQVRVQTKSSRPGVDAPDSEGVYKVRVNVPPVDGKANKAVRDALAKHFKVPKTSVELVKGQTSKTKTFEIPLES